VTSANAGHPLLRTPAPPPRADVVVIETTYGDRLHKPMDASVDELYRAISYTLGRGGNVIIRRLLWSVAGTPLDCSIGDLKKADLMPSMQIFLDSPWRFRNGDLCTSPRMLTA